MTYQEQLKQMTDKENEMKIKYTAFKSCYFELLPIIGIEIANSKVNRKYKYISIRFQWFYYYASIDLYIQEKKNNKWIIRNNKTI